MKSLIILSVFTLFTSAVQASILTRAVDVLVDAKRTGAWILPGSGRTLNAPSQAQLEISYTRFHRFVTRYVEDSDRSWSGPALSRETPEIHDTIRRSGHKWATAGVSLRRDFTVRFSLLSLDRLQAHEVEEVTSLMNQKLAESGLRLTVMMDKKTQKITLETNLFKVTERQLRSITRVFTEFKETDVALGF
jgi:hypothetical protein